MRKGVFGFDIWFYGLLAMVLAVCQQPLLLGGLMAFAFLMEKDEWLNRQLIQALLLWLAHLALSKLAEAALGVLSILPFFVIVTAPALLLVDFLLDVLLLGFALRACDRMHRGVDSDIPFIAGFVSSIF